MKDIFITRSSMPDFDEYIDEIKDIWDSHWLTNMGQKHRQLDRALCSYLNVNQLELLINGHMALEMSLQALNLKGEVITTPFTFASTTHAITRNNLIPVFCDIDPDDFTIDPKKIEALITEKTCAIMPVHVYGNICHVEEIEAIAKKYDLRVIYDAAHTFGEVYKGIPVGRLGDVSCFSFHATKVFNTIEGGAVCFQDPEIGRNIYRLKNFGIRNEECVDGVGANAKMNEFCAAMGLCNLRHVDADIQRRKEIHYRYHEHLKNIDGIQLRKKQPDVVDNYAYYPVVFDREVLGFDRNQVHRELLKHQIHARKYFYPLTSAYDCYQGRFDVHETPIALKISRSVLTLPLYPELQDEDVDRICRVILDLIKT